MNEYRVTIIITDGENELTQDFYVEAESFNEAVANLENDLDIEF